MVGIELIAAYLLGLMPIYLMLIRVNRTLGGLQSDHGHVENRLERIESNVSENEDAIGPGPADD